jgi:hypothetical protein
MKGNDERWLRNCSWIVYYSKAVPGVPMDPVKVVVRYADGKVIKGYTQDFFPNKDRFHLHPQQKSSGQDTEQVLVKELKAIFFVKDFDGNPAYDERRQFSDGEKAQGRKMEILFKDGEKLVGSTLGYEPNRPGFFVNPVDDKSNNIRVFVVQASVDRVRNL